MANAGERITNVHSMDDALAWQIAGAGYGIHRPCCDEGLSPDGAARSQGDGAPGAGALPFGSPALNGLLTPRTLLHAPA